MSHQILLSQLKEKIAAEAHYNIAAIFDQKNNGCWETIAVESYQNIAVRSCPDTNCCWSFPKILLSKVFKEIAAETYQKCCCESFPEKIDIKSQQNIALKTVQRKCCTAVLTNQNVEHRPKLTKNLLMCMITVGEAAEQQRN